MTYIRKNNYRRKQKEHTKIRNKTIRKSNKKEELKFTTAAYATCCT